MSTKEALKVGISREEQFLVEEKHSAKHIGSGTASVLSTPWLIAWVEHVCMNLLADYFTDEQSSVGVHIQFSHLAPTPIGFTVQIQSVITQIHKNRITFAIEAHDEIEKIGEGTHQRAIIDNKRFMQRVQKKK